MEKTTRNAGLLMIVAGLAVIVYAVLAGLTKEAGGPDWVSIITAIAGSVMAVTGVYSLFRAKRPGPGTGEPTPHGAS